MKSNRSLVMGILNVTPDSFSDGGKHFTSEAACAHAASLVKDGADIVDIGGESARPGSLPVSAEEELKRVLPVIQYLKSHSSTLISIDTTKPEVAEVAARAGAHLLNDISGGSRIEMAEIAKQFGLTVVLMHMQGTPRTMQARPEYLRGVTEEVSEFLSARVRAFEEVGLDRERIWVDPGIGFGKTLEHNLTLMRNLRAFTGIGARLVVGTSRKSFLSPISGIGASEVTLREPATLATNLWAREQGASVFRVHQVAEMRRALSAWEILRGENL